MSDAELYYYRKENRLCTQCGKPMPENDNHVKCDKCRLKESERKAVAQNKKKGNKGKPDPIDRIVREIMEYNEKHGTALSYGRYMEMKRWGEI